MTIPGSLSSPLLASAAGGAAGDFSVARSLRFNSADSAHLNRTPSSASNRKTWTWSGWVKRSSNTQTALFHAGSSNQTVLWFDGNHLEWTYYAGGYGARLRSSALFRDFSAWMHVVFVLDTTQATANSRMRMYINGAELTDFATRTNPSQNADYNVNNTVAHEIGRNNVAGGYNFNGYLAEINFVDGAALDPTSFGAFDDNGVWQATDTAGLSFGTNGFRLQFADNSGSTATTLGKDTSGNSNNWSPNNLSTSAPGLATANQGMDVVTYSGNGSSRNISGLAFAPDLVIIKSKSNNGYNHYWVDRVRGTNKNLFSNSTEATQTADRLSSFNSNGFGLTSHDGVNSSGKTYVAWCWKAGGAASSNTDGTITSSVSANSSYGFSVCTYTGTGSAASVGHNLNAVPALIILKDRSSAYNWQVYHKSFAGTSNGIVLNSTGAIDTGSGSVWNSTTPTSTVFSIGNSVGVNKSGDNYVAYVWSEVAGFSKISSYTGNGSNTGPVVTTGFKPRFLVVKRTDSVGNWTVYDSARSLDKDLKWNTSEAETTIPMVFLDDGFQPNSATGSVNASGATYVYMAFAAKPDASGIDSLVDTPSNGDTADDTGSGGQVTGNYCTMNPLDNGGLTLANGNLDVTMSTSAWRNCRATIGMTTGKWYFEVECKASTSGQGLMPGILNAAGSITTTVGANSGGYAYNAAAGNKYNSNNASSYGASFTNGDIIGIAYDGDNGTLTFYKNGASQGVAFTSIPSGTYFPAVAMTGTMSASINFGSRAFSYSAPTNFKSLNTANLPTPTIADGSKYFDTLLWTGDGSTTRAITGLEFSPDLCWTKARSIGFGHRLWDIVRGATKRLESHATTAEATETSGVKSFDSNGFTIGSDGNVNQNNYTFASWNWDGGNGDKTYAITVANPGSGNKYYADGALQPTLTLAEGSTYKFDQSHSSNATHPLRFSTTNDGTHGSGSQYTTGVTTAGTPGNAGAFTQIVIAASAPTLYAYCTNHSGMGFQVNTSDAGGFTIPADSLTSSLYNQSQNWTNLISFNAGSWNGNGINPFNENDSDKDYGNTSRASGGYATLNISSLTGSRVISVTSEQTEVTITHAGGTTTFTPPNTNRITHTFDAVTNPTSIKFDGLNSNSQFVLVGVSVDGARLVNSGISLANVPAIASQVRAQPSAGFSICSYVGNGSSGTVGHGLNDALGMIIAKDRDASTNWFVYHTSLGSDAVLLNSTAAAFTPSPAGINATSSSTFTLGGARGETNTNGNDYIAYCFAPVEGYSAMGSYIGNGSTDGPFIYTGMKPRWIMIKRVTDGAENWRIVDTARDTYNLADAELYANSSSAELSSDLCDILSNGFKIRVSFSGSNTSGKEYIWIAFAENPFQANGGLAR